MPWCSTSDHDSPEGGIELPLLSVAEPENEIRSPTAQVVPDVGALIVTFGRPTPITTESVSEAPSGSLTLSEATWVPGLVYVQAARAALESSYAPSPSRSQA